VKDHTPEHGLVVATDAYERWLGEHMALVADDLALKHRLMASGSFAFLRGTAYRWAQRWPVLCRELMSAPPVLAVGDLHVENFGTWRDAEGRLVWGINDIDEAIQLPYASDLVRLAASAVVACGEDHLSVAPTEVAEAVLAGYEAVLIAGGVPFVLAESHGFLRDLAAAALKDPVRYWEHLLSPPTVEDADLPAGMAAAVRAAMPDATVATRLCRRVAGVGSLGRPRAVVTGTLAGAAVAREAKVIAPSAWTWASTPPPDTATPAQRASAVRTHAATLARLASTSVRSQDPAWCAEAPWLIRRLAPDCSRIELADLPVERDERRLLRAMGAETANLHLATAGAAATILADLRNRPKGWLEAAAETMAEDIRADHKAWVAYMADATAAHQPS